MFLNIFIILLSAVFGAFLYVKRCYSFWIDHSVPFIQPSFPFGNLKSPGPTIHHSLRMTKFYLDTKKNKLPFTGLYFLLRPVALITDLELVKKILIKDFHHFEDRGFYYNQKSDPLSAHLVNLESSKWKRLRSKLSPTFTSGKMKFMFPTIVSVGNEFVDCLSNVLKSGNEIEIRDLLGRFTTDVIGTCAFGIECNSLRDPNAKFRQMGKKMFEEPTTNVITRSLMVSNKKLARFLGLRELHRDVTKFFLNCVKETIEYREKNNVQRNDFMDLLIQLKNDKTQTEENRLTLNEIAAQAFVFFLAGFETSSTTLTFALYELAQSKNKHIQDRARAEINEVMAKYDGQLTYEGLNEMPYIEQIINESLRKYTPIGSLVRVVTKDYECPEARMVFREGMAILIPAHGIHHDPEIYEQPEQFMPERFSAEAVKKRPSCSFLPFGDGPRNCIAMRFGMLQTRIGLVVLLKRFRFATCDRTPPMPMQFCPKKTILSPVDGVWLNIQPV